MLSTIVQQFPMPTITLKKNCVYIQINKDILHVIKKESILAYCVRGTYSTELILYTSIPKLDICIEYNSSENDTCIKHVELLQSILSPEIQPSADLLTLTAENVLKN